MERKCKNCQIREIGWTAVRRERLFKKSLREVETNSCRGKKRKEVLHRMIRESNLPVKNTCTAVGMSRSNYYKYGKQVNVCDTELPLLNEIENITLDFPGYGYRQVTKQLHRQGKNVNHKKVLRIMREANLTHKKKKFKLVTTNSDHDFPIYKNLVKNITVTHPNQVWVSDITYIRLINDYVYLAVIVDLFSRKCIGWDISRNIDTTLAISVLDMAINTRQHLGFNDLIHHSDQGMQYASHEYVNQLEELGIRISMSRRGNPYDNAFAESFIKTLKAEEVYIKEYRTFGEAYRNIKEFIELVYNKKRLHSSIGYLPPDEFEALKTSLT